MTQEEYSAVCPYLGLADDADSHATYPTEAHRCYRLPNPTRIATPHQETYCLGANHVSCPVYLGEGVPKATPAPAAAPVAAIRPESETTTVRGPRQGDTQQQRAFGGGQAPAPRQRRPQAAAPVGPRPRRGGVSMPVATIALFALAIIVIALAFAIQQLVGGGGDDTLSPADVTGTNVANRQTATAKAGGSQPTQPASSTTPAPGGSQTAAPGGSATVARTGTAQATAPGGTPGAKTYTVKSGDNCGTIAAQFGVTADALIAANQPAVNADCTNLSENQVLKIP